MQWKRQDQMTVKERAIMKETFLNTLLNDKEYRWKYVEIEGSITEYMISNDGRLASLRMCRMMRPSHGSDGYLETIIRHNGKKYNVAIHRLVAIAFIPNPDHLPEVNHKDGNKDHNYDWNLEWITHYDNVIHAIETGLRDNYLPKRYSRKKIHSVCKMLERGMPTREIHNKTGVSKSVIKSIKRGKSWKYISKLYEIPGLNSYTRANNSQLKEQSSTTTESFDSSYYIDEEVCFSWELVR